MIRKSPMKRKFQVPLVAKGLILTLLCVVLHIAPAHATSIATFDVDASFIADIPIGCCPATLFTPPTLSVTGQIFYDIDANTVLGMDMSFLGATGLSRFSMQGSGGCGDMGFIFRACTFSGQSGSALVSFAITPFSPIFEVGQSFGACAVRSTIYPTGENMGGSGACGATSNASLGNGEAGVVYTKLDGTSSGRLTVTAIPEPETLLFLAFGLMGIVGCQWWQRGSALAQSRGIGGKVLVSLGVVTST